MKKALIITTVSGFVPQFEMNNVRILQELGYEVHYASNFRNPHYGKDNSRLEGTGIICHQVDMERSPFCIGAAKRSYRQLKKLLQTTHFELIHCHTPMGGVLARFAVRSTQSLTYNPHSSTVIYTAHGFHFYKGAPLVNWLLYYPVERWLARYTDKLITINEEDYERAKRFYLRKAGQVFKVNGVGIDVEKYQKLCIDREAKRRELGVGEDEFLMVSVGELSKRKNHQVVIRALAELKRRKPYKKLRYLIAGEGSERAELESLIRKSGLQDSVVLLGYRTDISELLAAADCFVFPSKQEGLPVALMEAIVMGVPCIAADIRGCRDLLDAENLVKKNLPAEYADVLEKTYGALEKWKEAENKTGKAEQRKQQLDMLSEQRIKKQMHEIYTC